MDRLNSRKGFTVVELVVAMAIILIVSATAIAIVNTQNTVYLRTTQTVEATNMAENAIECFRFAVNNGEDFKTVFEKTGCEVTEDENGNYVTESNGMTVTITIDGNTLNFTALDGNKEILSKSYTR